MSSPDRQGNSQEQTHRKAVLFCDFDGPIVDVSNRYYQTYRLGLSTVQATYQTQTAESLPLHPLTKEQFWWMKQNKIADLEIATRSGLPDALIETFMQQVSRLVNHPYLLQWDRLQPGADKAIALLKRAGIRLVLVTLRHPRQVQAFLQAHDLSLQIDEVFGTADLQAAQVNRTEQKVELLQRAIATQIQQGYCPDNTWMIGDTEADVVAGQTAGLNTIALTCGIRSKAYLKHFNPDQMQPNLLAAVAAINPNAALQAA
jgi:phosphoglycolate phosphatase